MANDLCFDYLNTSLASIHSDDDNAIARQLCSAATWNNVWIGLSRVNIGSNTFIWADDTTLDYGDDVSGGVFPWSARWSEPNNGSENGEGCATIAGWLGYEWNDVECDGNRNYICNKPSELCYEQQWDIIQQQGEISVENCMVKMYDTTVAVISKKKWGAKNIASGLIIEYTFKIEELLSDKGEMAILMYGYNGNVCDFMSFGLIVSNAGIELKRTRFANGIHTIQVDNTAESLQLNHYYQFLIKCAVDNKQVIPCNITLDGILLTQFFVTNINDDRYIGILNENMRTTAKSLFISGTPEFVESSVFDQCTFMPTSSPTLRSNAPSLYPSSNPSKNPTSIPTIDPTSNPSEEPTFAPSISPTEDPTSDPSGSPTLIPSISPTAEPTMLLSLEPTVSPTPSPLTDGIVVPETTSYYNAESSNLGQSQAGLSGFLISIMIAVPLLSCCIILFCCIVKHKMNKDAIESANDEPKGIPMTKGLRMDQLKSTSLKEKNRDDDLDTEIVYNEDLDNDESPKTGSIEVMDDIVIMDDGNFTTDRGIMPGNRDAEDSNIMGRDSFEIGNLEIPNIHGYVGTAGKGRDGERSIEPHMMIDFRRQGTAGMDISEEANANIYAANGQANTLGKEVEDNKH